MFYPFFRNDDGTIFALNMKRLKKQKFIAISSVHIFDSALKILLALTPVFKVTITVKIISQSALHLYIVFSLIFDIKQKMN